MAINVLGHDHFLFHRTYCFQPLSAIPEAIGTQLLDRTVFCLAASDVMLLFGSRLAILSEKGLGCASRLGKPHSEPLSDVYPKSPYFLLRNHPEALPELKIPKSGNFLEIWPWYPKKAYSSLSQLLSPPTGFYPIIGQHNLTSP